MFTTSAITGNSSGCDEGVSVASQYGVQQGCPLTPAALRICVCPVSAAQVRPALAWIVEAYKHLLGY